MHIVVKTLCQVGLSKLQNQILEKLRAETIFVCRTGLMAFLIGGMCGLGFLPPRNAMHIIPLSFLKSPLSLKINGAIKMVTRYLIAWQTLTPELPLKRRQVGCVLARTAVLSIFFAVLINQILLGIDHD